MHKTEPSSIYISLVQAEHNIKYLLNFDFINLLWSKF